MTTIAAAVHMAELEPPAAAVSVDATSINPKVIATLIARAALAGYSLRVDGDEAASTFMVSRWDLCKALRSVAEVESFLQRAGSPA